MESKSIPKPPKWWSKINAKIDAKRYPQKEGRRKGRSPPLVVLSRHTLLLVSQAHISTPHQTLKTARRHRYADARPDLRRKRQPAAHAVPCISETAEKIVKYTVFVEVTPWMEPKGAKSEPKDAKREPKGAKMDPKSIKNL